jgi:hypothetical protein
LGGFEERKESLIHRIVPAASKLSKQPVIASVRQLPGEAIRMRVRIAGDF